MAALNRSVPSAIFLMISPPSLLVLSHNEIKKANCDQVTEIALSVSNTHLDIKSANSCSSTHRPSFFLHAGQSHLRNFFCHGMSFHLFCNHDFDKSWYCWSSPKNTDLRGFFSDNILSFFVNLPDRFFSRWNRIMSCLKMIPKCARKLFFMCQLDPPFFL